MKKIGSILLVLVIIASLSACSSQKNSIVGEWYNIDGKCLDIRSDGSWILEDSYGIGTWEELEDKIYEFTDFYGDTKESAINNDDNGEFIVFGINGNFYRDQYPSTNDDIKDSIQNNLNDNKQDILCSVTKYHTYGEGCAWVTYNDGEKDMNALIARDGSELYSFSCEYDIDYYPIDGGLCFYINQNGAENPIHTLINANGKVIGSATDGTFDAVLAYGDGIALVYKHETGMTDNKHLYGIIDAEGNWKQEYRDLDINPLWYDLWNAKIVKYAGEGMFTIKNGNEVTLYDSETSTVTNVKTDADSFYFVNGYAYFGNGFLIKTDGTLTEIENFDWGIKYDYITNGYIVRDKGAYLEIEDYTTKKTVKYTKHTNHGTSITFYDDYGVVTTIGNDGNKYVTIINENCEEQYEPTMCTPNSLVYFSNGYIVYNTENGWCVCDPKGNITLSNLEVAQIALFEDDVLLTSDGQLLDINGAQIFTTVMTK